MAGSVLLRPRPYSIPSTLPFASNDAESLQEKIRTPWLDAYFVYTSTLGTHTFFMIILPALFFFGYDELGRGYEVLHPFDIIGRLISVFQPPHRHWPRNLSVFRGERSFLLSEALCSSCNALK